MTIIKRLSGSNEEISRILYEEQLQLSQQNLDVEEAVAEIIETVKQDGDQALRDYTMLFDKVEVTDFEIGQELIDKAFEEIDPEVLVALKNAQANIESYHRQQLETGFEDTPSEGVIRGQLIRPIERVGTYVPGGTAAYPSSVLMNVIPAKIAGVKRNHHDYTTSGALYPSDFGCSQAGWCGSDFPNWRCPRCSCPGLWN